MTIKKAYCFLSLLCCLLTLPCFALPVSTDGLLAKHIDLLKTKQSTLKKTLLSLDDSNIVDEGTLKKTITLNSMQQEDVSRNLQFAESEKDELIKRQQYLKKRLDTPTRLPNENTRLLYADLNQALIIKQQEISLLSENQSLMQAINKKHREIFEKLVSAKSKGRQSAQRAAIKENIQSLRSNVYVLLDKKIGLEKAKDDGLNAIEKQIKTNLLSIKININQLAIEQQQLTLKLLYKDEPVKFRSLPVLTLRINALNEIGLRIEKTSKLQNALTMDLEKKIPFLQSMLKNKQISRSFYISFTKQLTQLKEMSSRLGLRIRSLETQAQTQIKENQSARSQWTSVREGFFSFDLPHWKKIGEGIMTIPTQFSMYVYSLIFRVQSFVLLLPFLKQLAMFCLVIVLILFWLSGRKLFIQLIEKETRYRLGEDLLHVLTRLFRRNWGAICLFAGLMLLFNLAGLSLQSYKLVLMLFVVWFSFRAIIGITRLTLLEGESNVDGHDVALYHRLRWTFIVGGLVTILMALTHQLSISHQTSDFFDRLFMLFLFAVSIVLLRGRQVILMLLESFLKPKRFYMKRALLLFCILAPSALLFNALVGLLGYALLAWVMSYYLLVLILGLIAYVVLRGILNDTVELVADGLIEYAKNGWLWREVFLKPLHRILRFGLFIAFIVFFISMFGWDSESGLVKFLFQAWQFHVFNFTRVNITIASFVEFTFLLIMFIWLSKWTRECCYRWIYKGIKDLGIRNSFAVFTQYAMVTLGAVLTLRVLGVDVSGMSMILGGLAVGLGFGLRDFANNIVGGLMLLIERPIKVGDLISVDNFEGRVTHIGIRSMRVRSWDHLEVMIPNATTFSSPFTNWTHKDDVVRTVVPIKLSRQDSPTKVQQLIFDVLEIIPEVLEDPNPQVYLKHIDEALIEFEVRYFINIKSNSRMAVRSIVLFALTAQFNAAGIKAPIPPLSIENVTPCKS